MIPPRTLAGALLAVVTVAAFSGIRAAATTPPPYTGTLVPACSTATQGQQCSVTFTLTAASGQRAPNFAVDLLVKGCGAVRPSVGVTDVNGQMTTTFIAASGCCGAVIITAIAPAAQVTTTAQVVVPCSAVLSATPPGTGAGDSHSPPQATASADPAPAWPVTGIAGAVLILGGAGLLLGAWRRRALERR